MKKVVVNKLMINGKRQFFVFFVVLVCTASVYAGMMPMSTTNADGRQLLYVPRSQADLQYSDLSDPLDCLSDAYLDFWPVDLSPEPTENTGQTSEIQNLQSLTDGPGSFALCLYAMIGLGLCTSAPWTKKLSFEFIPEWYHDGGPFQIGHSHAVMPETLCNMQVYCFIQPAWMVESLIPEYSSRTIVSLWRESQFTPDVIAARGPPNMS